MEFVLIATAHFLALLSPGPDFFLIMQASLRMPLRYGVAICAGIAMANAAYLFFAVLGLEVIKELGWLMTILQYCGALYLVFLGIMLLRAPSRGIDSKEAVTVLQARHLGRQFLLGFMSGIFNPKNAIFYLSLFTVMVSDQTGFITRCFYALWMTTAVFVWDVLMVIVIGQGRINSWFSRCVFVVEKFSGVMLLFFGVLLPFA
jgi:threonine/homoserine/homoserine lactone efflux protein